MCLVAGSVGPLGVRIAPFGRVQPEQARTAFAEQIGALAEAGADLIVIETMSDLYEIQEAIKAANKSVICQSWLLSRSHAMTGQSLATTRPKWREFSNKQVWM